MIAFIEKWAVEGLAVLLVLTISALGVQTYRIKAYQLDVAKVTSVNADLQAKAEQAARTKERAAVVAVTAASSDLEKGKKDADQIQTTLFADLNSLNKRLSPVWRCETPASVPQGATPASKPSATEQQRNESTSRIIGATHSCDAQVAALQKAYNDVMHLINGN